MDLEFPEAMKLYTGIGSRETPDKIRKRIHELARILNEMGYTLRSGGAPGADSFFEEASDRLEIYLPWNGFNGRPRKDLAETRRYYQSPTDEAISFAEEHINGFNFRSRGAQLLLSRNMHQVLGYDLKTPSEFIICWTPGGKIQGGTAHAIRLAKSQGIDVYNLAKEKDQYLLDEWLGRQSQGKLF